MARFYFNHLVRGSDNQLWLISHSDTLLRESVNLEDFDVFHMRRGDRTVPEENQAVRITTGEEVERLIIELVGDLAAYRPGAKVVLFEGGGDVEFDVRMVARLFPDFDTAVNAIAAGNKQQVTALHGVLDRIGSGALGARFYAVRDRDTGGREEEAARVYTWNAYHIENYLLEPEYVYRALTELSRSDASLTDPEAVRVALEKCAGGTIPDLVKHELIVEANDAIVRALRVGGRSGGGPIADGIHPSIEGSLKGSRSSASPRCLWKSCASRREKLRASLEVDLGSGDWRQYRFGDGTCLSDLSSGMSRERATRRSVTSFWPE